MHYTNKMKLLENVLKMLIMLFLHIVLVEIMKKKRFLPKENFARDYNT